MAQEGADPRWTRRAALATGAALAGAWGAGCRRLGPPAATPLDVAGELVPASTLQVPFHDAQPDIALSFSPWPPGEAASAAALDAGRFADGGARRSLAPLDARFTLVGFLPEVIVPGALAAFQGSGGQLALPFARSRLVVLFDAQAFRAASLPLPTAPWTWEDLLRHCARLRAAGSAPPLADPAGLRVDAWAALTAGRGGAVAATAGGTVLPPAATPAAAAAWIDVARLAAVTAPGAALRPGGAAIAFRFFPLPSEVAALQKAGMAMGVLPFPASASGPATPVRAWGHGIPAVAPEAGAALRFVTWCAGGECQQALWRAGYVPVIADQARTLQPLGAAAGEDPAARAPDSRWDRYLPPALRLSGAATRSLEAALAATSPTAGTAEAAAAYARAVAGS